MNLSSELISQFVKITKDDKKVDNGSTVYGVIVEYNGQRCVKLDGSDQITPITSTADVLPGDRVSVLIKNHTATVTGNVTSPSARKESVDNLEETVNDHGSKISEFEIVVADMVTVEQLNAAQANIELVLAEKVGTAELEAQRAEIDEVLAKKASIESLEAAEADIDEITANMLTVDAANAKYATIENLDATNAEFNTLESTFATFEETTTNKLTAMEADIGDLDTKKLSTTDADIKYANIDFSNIGEAAVEKLFTESGIIKDLIMSDGVVTGELVGVTIKGDLIEAGTVKADKLVVKGSDGIYYKLNIEAGATTSEEVTEEELQNGLHGTAIIAKTITAEKIAVDDLVAFDATIGGFHITDSSLYSGVKETATNLTRGIYLDKEGQISAGDNKNYLRYYKTENGEYKLEIAASSIVFSASGKNVEEVIEESTNIEVGARNLLRNSKTLIFDKYYFEYGNPSAVLGEATLGSMKLGQE